MTRSKKGFYLLGTIVALAFVITACTPKQQEQVTDTLTQEVSGPSVTVSNQEITDGQVVVAQVVSDGVGWMVIHADNGEGKPGAVIGQTAVNDGVNNNVTVAIDDKQATDKLFAMLHIDAGQTNTYEFPGVDVPTTLDGNVVVKGFNVTGTMIDDGDATDDSGTSLKVPAPDVDPDSVDEMIVDDGHDGDAITDDGDAMEAQTKVFNVGGVNFALDVKEIRVKKGDTVTINFTSNGGFHDWTVAEFNAAASRVNSGGSSSVTFVADKAGTFEYYCSVGSHRALGMVGNLIVE